MSKTIYRTVLESGYECCAACGELMLSGDEVIAAVLAAGTYYAHENCLKHGTPFLWKRELKWLEHDGVLAMATSEEAAPAGSHTFGPEMTLLSKSDSERFAKLAEKSQRESQTDDLDPRIVTPCQRRNGKPFILPDRETGGNTPVSRIRDVAPGVPVKLRNHAQPQKQSAQDDGIDKHFSVLQFLRAHE